MLFDIRMQALPYRDLSISMSKNSVKEEMPIQPSPGHPVGIWLPSVVALGAILRLYRLGAQSFWHDEAVQYDVSGRSLLSIVTGQWIPMDSLPPFSHTLFHFWLKLGHGEWWFRLLTVMAGVATIYVVYLLGMHLLGRKQGIIAAFLLAISPFHIWHSQDARPYTFMILLSAASMLFFLRLLDRNSLRDRLLFIVCGVLAAYSHPYGLFLPMAQMAYVLAISKRRLRPIIPRLADFALVVALYVPWILVLLTMLNRATGSSKAVGLHVIPYTFYAYTFGYSVGPSVPELHMDQSARMFLPYLPIIAPFALAFAGAFLSGISAENVWRRQHVWLVLPWLIVPVLGAYAAAKVTSVTYNARYASVAFIPYTLLLANGIACLRFKSWRPVALALLTLSSAYAIRNYYCDLRYSKEDWRAVADYVRRHEAPGDGVFVSPSPTFIRYYNWNSGSAKVFQPRVMMDSQQEFVRIRNEAELHGYRRLWLIALPEQVDHPNARSLLAKLDRAYKIENRKDFTRIRLFLYRLPSHQTRPPQESAPDQ